MDTMPRGPRTRVAAALLIGALLAGACSRVTQDSAAAGQTQGEAPARYRQALAATAKALTTALAGIAGASTFAALSEGLVRAERAASAAANQLGQLTPPDDAGAQHADLVRALRQLDGDLSDLTGAVKGQELCASRAVMARLGTARGLAAVRDAGAAPAAAGGAQGYRLDLEVPAVPGEQNRRLGNGQLVRAGSRTGQGALTIKNRSQLDTTLTLALGRRAVFSVYIRGNATSKVTGIRDGDYRIWYTNGFDWDPRARAFTRDCGFERFNQNFDFRTNATKHIDWIVTLVPATSRSAQLSKVDPRDYLAV